MKKSRTWILILLILAAVIAAVLFFGKDEQVDKPLPTPTESVVPTTEPEATVMPTAEPTAEPTTEPTMVPEPTVEPTATPEPTETPTPEPTAEPTILPTATPEPTATSTPIPTPTEVPHEHSWVTYITYATCTEEGYSLEKCACGEQQNTITIPATGHKPKKKVVKEATINEEGIVEEVCTECNTVISTSTIPKPTPTATPRPTATPAPTATPTPTTEKPFLMWRDGEVKGDHFTIGNISPTVFELEVANYMSYFGYNEDDEWDTRRTIIQISLSDESIISFDERLFNLLGRWPDVCVTPNAVGTVEVTVTVYEAVDRTPVMNKKFDSFTFTIEVVEEKSKVDISDYDPTEQGYTIQIGEWQCGDDIYASVWWNGIEEKSDGGREILVFTGTGAMWTAEERRNILGTDSPWKEFELNKYSHLFEEIYFCEGITRIEKILCAGVKTLTLPHSLREIGEGAFDQLHVTELVIPEGVERMERRAFSRADKLETLILPSTLKYIGSSAFATTYWSKASSKHKLMEVHIPASVEYMGEAVFDNRWGITLILPEDMDTSGFHKEWLGWKGDKDQATVTYE